MRKISHRTVHPRAAACGVRGSRRARAARGRRPPPVERSAAARRARAAHRHDLSGAHDGTQSGARRRQPDWRGAVAPPGPARGARRARAPSSCWSVSAWPIRPGAAGPIPSALRWHEAARDDRHGTGRRARDVDRRRADHGAGCHHPGPGAGAAARAAAAERHGDPAHYPRSWRGGGDGGPGGRDVRRTDRGAGAQHELLRRSSPSLQPQAVRVCSGRREARARAGSHSRDGTFSAPGIRRLQVRRALPVGLGPVPQRSATLVRYGKIRCALPSAGA